MKSPHTLYITLFSLLVLSIAPFSFAQTDLPETKEITPPAPFSPLAKSTPSWALSFRPQQRPGFRVGKYFFMDIPSIGAGLRYEFKDERRENHGIEQTERYHRFAERIGFRTKGWLYNPALCTFSATLEPELSQVYEEDSAGQTEKSNLFTPDYLLSATLLERKPYTLNLHAKRRELPSWAAFKGGFETRIHDYGGDLDLDLRQLLQTSDFYHASFDYRHTDSSVDGFFTQDDISDNFYLDLKQERPGIKTEFKSFYTDREQINEDIETRTKTFDSQLFNTFVIRQENRIALNSAWSYRFQDLDIADFQNFRLHELLNVRHRKNLTSLYEFTYNYEDTNGSNESNRAALHGRLEHLLFENLTTTAGAKGLYSDFSSGIETTVAPYLNLSYTRKVPGGGISLGSNWNYSLTIRDDDRAQGGRVVQNERHTLSFSQDSFLQNYNVITDTVVVTNLDGTIQYTEGIDYQVEVIGNYVSIRSLSLGSIDNGQAVLVHYAYQQDSGYDDSLFTQQYSMAYTFLRNTTLQLSHARSKQDIIDGPPPSVMTNDIINRASIQHRIDWSTTRLEFADFDRESHGSYQNWQITQRLALPPLFGLNFSLAGYYGETLYNEREMDDVTRTDSESYGGTLTASWRISRRLLFNMEGFTNIREDDFEDTVNTGLRSSLAFTYRIWTARLSYELSNQGIRNESTDSSRLRNYIRFDVVRLYW